MSKTVFRTCTLCEAMCGLKFEVEGDKILSIVGDDQDVFSHGYICPKGAALAAVHDDPDRLRTPVRRTPAGDFEPIGWDEAFRLAAEGLAGVRARHGKNAIGVYIGNPVAHNHGALVLRDALFKAIGTRNCTSASSQDTSPRFAASHYLYGNSLAVPVPDLDRTDYFLCIGANPRVSNGSLLAAGDIRKRLQDMRARGGKLVVIDPRRSETAREADEHIAILPGGDAALLLAMVQTIVSEGLAQRASIDKLSTGFAEIEKRLAAFEPQRVASVVGIDAATIRRLARDFAAARTATAYSRIGVCNGAHGTLASMATDLLNLVAGRLGSIGGAMFSAPAFDSTPIVKLTGADGHGRWRSRVRGLPETLGDLPASILAEEMETAGEGQIRALFTFAGNPVLSVPNGRRLDAAIEKLDFMVSVDLYINETTRHADVILPPAWGLYDEHVDLLFPIATVRNIARWSPPLFERPAEQRADWEILLELIYRLGGGPTGFKPLDWFYRLVRHVGWKWTPSSTLDLLLRIGPYGDRFLPWSKGLNLKKLARAEHGIDLGALQEGIAHRVLHRDKRMHLDAPVMLAAMDELAASLPTTRIDDDSLLLIGRRELRSNNSWMHNVPQLVSGKPRCVLLIHPQDAQRLGLADGELAELESRVHQGPVPIRISDEMRPGVVSLPHGWGHAASARWQRTAATVAGVSANDWTDDEQVESVVGQSILNGVRVQLRRSTQQKAPEPGAAESPHLIQQN